MSLQKTEEQIAIIEAAVTSKDNLLIEALAGSSKSTTLRFIAEALPRVSILCLAFNKRIADELNQKLPSNCQAQTLNSLGHRAWGTHLKKRLYLDSYKITSIVRELIDGLDKDRKAAVWKEFGTILKVCSFAKAHGHVPNVISREYGPKVSPLMDNSELLSYIDEEILPESWDIICKALEVSMRKALSGTIDFEDQLLMPAIFNVSFPSFQLVMGDEVQDWSELNHILVERLVKRYRLIAVGDRFQAIYAFRGAHENGMDVLKDRFAMRSLSLSCSFRCPEAIVEHVRWRAQNITSWAGNPNNPGTINTLPEWSASTLPDGCAVLCRNNAPLFKMAIRLLKAGRNPNLWGNDIAKGLLKTLEELGPKNMTRDEATSELSSWHMKKEKKAKTQGAKNNLADRVACVQMFIDEAETLGGAMVYANHVLTQTGPVNLLTGHKSKGHEWKDVFILDEDLMSDEGQDPNLRYVMATRSEKNLTYIYGNEYMETI